MSAAHHDQIIRAGSVSKQVLNAYKSVQKRSRSSDPSVEGIVMQIKFSLRVAEDSQATAHDVNHQYYGIFCDAYNSSFDTALAKGVFSHLNSYEDIIRCKVAIFVICEDPRRDDNVKFWFRA